MCNSRSLTGGRADRRRSWFAAALTITRVAKDTDSSFRDTGKVRIVILFIGARMSSATDQGLPGMEAKL